VPHRRNLRLGVLRKVVLVAIGLFLCCRRGYKDGERGRGGEGYYPSGCWEHKGGADMGTDVLPGRHPLPIDDSKVFNPGPREL